MTDYNPAATYEGCATRVRISSAHKSSRSSTRPRSTSDISASWATRRSRTSFQLPVTCTPKRFVKFRAASARASSSTTLIMSTTTVRLLYVPARSEEHTSELQSLMRISSAVFCLKQKKEKGIQEIYPNKDTMQ